MKSLIILCAIFFIVASAEVKTNKNDITNNVEFDGNFIKDVLKNVPYSGVEIKSIDDVVDVILEQLKNFMIGKGLDPMNVADVHRNFSYQPLWITYHGELDLKNGWLQDATTIYRSGEPKLVYDKKVITAEVPLGFKNFLLEYDYSAKIMNLGPTGSIEGRVKDVQLYCNLGINLGTMQITLNEFKITKIGKINLQFRGSFLFDWLINIFSSIFTSIFKGLITSTAEDTIRQIIEEIINGFNNRP